MTSLATAPGTEAEVREGAGNDIGDRVSLSGEYMLASTSNKAGED